MPWSRTGARIGFAFGAVLLVFGLAIVVNLHTLDRIAASEAEVARLDHAKHVGHHAETHVREQYIHQAHIIISGPGHTQHYHRAADETKVRTERLIEFARTEDERRLAESIARRAKTMDERFRAVLQPALSNGDRATVARVHDEIVTLGSKVTEDNRKLSASFEERSREARMRAQVLRGRAKWITLACCLAALAVAALLGLTLMRSIVRPIAVLTEGTKRLGSGDLDHRIEWPGRDEFADLADAFNRMTTEVATQQEKRVEAERLAVLGQIAAGIAHEINNPLGVILGYLKLMKRPGGATAERLAIVEDEARQCERIVKDLLDIARNTEIDPRATDLGQLIRSEVGRLQESGRLEGRRIEVDVPTEPIVLPIDGGRIRQVVANLVQNGVDATPVDGLVRLDLTTNKAGAQMVVTDSGAGMSVEEQAQAFDAFFTTKADGTGLGLAICRSIVEAHGGGIELTSGPGIGTRVQLDLPKKEADA